MDIGIPKETKMGESRVALMPDHVSLLTKAGHKVFVQKDAGKKCKFYNKDYKKEGATNNWWCLWLWNDCKS